MSTQSANVVTTNELSYQYDWYQKTFPPVVQEVFDDFFAEDFTFTLLGVCKNINTLADKDSYFVTKVKIDKQHDIFFRLSETAIGLVLDKVLGKAGKKIDLNKLTELETKIITTFNDCMYRSVVKFLKPAPPTLTRTNLFRVCSHGRFNRKVGEICYNPAGCACSAGGNSNERKLPY